MRESVAQHTAQKWWRRGESNSSPQSLALNLYVRSWFRSRYPVRRTSIPRSIQQLDRALNQPRGLLSPD